MNDPQSPDDALQQALAHHQAGRLAQAEPLYRLSLQAKPDQADVTLPLANVLLQQGKLDEAIEFYGMTLTRIPDSAEAHNNLGTALEHRGRLDEAAASYRRAIAAMPERAEMHANLGNVLIRQSRLEEAAASYRTAIALQTGDADVYYNLGNILAHQENWDEAAAVYKSALARNPNFAGAYFNLGNCLMRTRKPDGAAAAFQSALVLMPDFSKAHFNLGEALCQIGRVEEGFAAFTRSAALTHAQRKNTPRPPTPSFKLRHDQEQRDYLAGGQAPPAAPAIDDLFILGDGRRLVTPAVNPVNGGGDTAARWQSSRPQMVVVDDFLTPEALDRLRRFCWDSTIWRRIYEGGYLSATPEYGLSCPLLAQIAEELRETFPAIIGEHAFRYLWAVKYDGKLPGTKIHADQAAINVNFWITADDANLDPAHGGMIVWDVAAPQDWEGNMYNGDVAACRAYLARTGAKPITVPYRANRAVIFDSDLFHETDQIAFRDGYRNRRINITLIYGRRAEN